MHSEKRADRAAERAVLGAAILDSDPRKALVLAQAIVSAEDFHWPAHAFVWEALVALQQRLEPIDVRTLAHELQGRGRLQVLEGGVQYLDALTDETVTSAHIEAHARIVAGHAHARRLREAAREILDAVEREHDTDALTTLAHQKVASVRAARELGRFATFAEAASELTARQGAGRPPPGVMTGVDRLDALTLGLQPGHLVLLAARPRMGKTALAENFAFHAARSSGRRVLFFSEEMPTAEIVNRRLAGEARVNARLALSGLLDDFQAADYANAANRLRDTSIVYEDSGRVSAEDIAAMCRRETLLHGPPALILVDYLQRLKSIDARISRTEQVGASTKELKNLAKELGVPVVALSQLNRDCEKRPDKRPMFADLRDSGELEQEADIILFLFRPWAYDKTLDPKAAELNIAKHRGGPADRTLKLLFNGARARFENDPTDLIEEEIDE